MDLAVESIQFGLQQLPQRVRVAIEYGLIADQEGRCAADAERRAAFMIELYCLHVSARQKAVAQSVFVQTEVRGDLDHVFSARLPLPRLGEQSVVQGPELIVALVQGTLSDFGCGLAVLRKDDRHIAIDEIYLAPRTHPECLR